MEAAAEEAVDEINAEIVHPQAEALRMMPDEGVIDLLGAKASIGQNWPLKSIRNSILSHLALFLEGDGGSG